MPRAGRSPSRRSGIPHEEIHIALDDGRRLSAWYVPSRNGAAVLVSHGSGGSRGRVARHVRMLARHGYGVLALDNPGNGESEGHSNGFGDNAQPALDAGLDYLARRPDVDPERIAGFGVSLGGEVLLEAAARDRRLAAVVSDGGARVADSDRVENTAPLDRAVIWLAEQSGRAISGMEPSPPLVGMLPDIAPRPVLLVAGGPPGRGQRAAVPARRRRHRPAVDGPGRRSHRRAAQAPGRVRAAGGRLPGRGTEDAAVDSTSAVGHSFGKVFFRLLALSPRVLRGSVTSAHPQGYRRRSARWEHQSRETPTGWTSSRC